MNTTEEKARAIDIVKQMIVDGQVSQEVAEKYFPELKESEDERIRKDIKQHFLYLDDSFPDKAKWLAWLEKQGTERKQLYIRFGDIPSNEKSKIYRGEEEIGDENGVSVYPAFELNGNIVLGLTLPITKTTLYTQQHLLEYDNRPCYLVSGDYVGKDTDGQPLINNVSIIEKIDTYRVKYKKQGEQKPADKVEPKFNVGDWITNSIETVQITGYDIDYGYQVDYKGNLQHRDTDIIEKEYHLWTIQDAKDGDVLQLGGVTAIFREYLGKYIGHEHCKCYCSVCNGEFEIPIEDGEDNIYGYATPATKEQNDLLFTKMKEAGYEWDAEKKELKLLITNGGDFESGTCEQKHVWSEEDEHTLQGVIDEIQANKNQAPDYDFETYDRFLSWLKSLKQRIG